MKSFESIYTLFVLLAAVMLTISLIERTVSGVIAEYLNSLQINGKMWSPKPVEDYSRSRFILSLLVPVLWVLFFILAKSY
jgi:hypothetical protein